MNVYISKTFIPIAYLAAAFGNPLFLVRIGEQDKTRKRKKKDHPHNKSELFPPHNNF
jgi:hypothetical protein